MALIGHWLLNGDGGYTPSIVDYSSWILGTTGSQPEFGNLVGTESENKIMLKENPWGKQDIVWATENNDAESNADGGFDNVGYNNVDPTKKYRYSIWMRRENAGNGSIYLGCGANVKDTGTDILNTNPYFTHTSISNRPELENNWVLVIAHIHPHTLPIGAYNDPETGMYVDGIKIIGSSTTNPANGVRDFKWSDETITSNYIRSFLYYSTVTDEKAYFYRPRVDLCDGTEPTIEELLILNENPNIYTILEDKSYNFNNGYTEGKAIVDEDGKIGDCHKFIGTTKYIVPNNENINNNISNDFTISFWAKPVNTNFEIVMEKQFGNMSTGIRIGKYSGGNWGMLYKGEGMSTYEDVVPSTTSVDINIWQHIAYIRENGRISIYKNGINVYTHPVVNSASLYNTQDLWIGIRRGLSSGFNGKINDIRIYNNAISDKEIYDISKAKILHYKLNNNNYSVDNLLNTSAGLQCDFNNIILDNVTTPPSITIDGWYYRTGHEAEGNTVFNSGADEDFITMKVTRTSGTSGLYGEFANSTRLSVIPGETYTLSIKILEITGSMGGAIYFREYKDGTYLRDVSASSLVAGKTTEVTGTVSPDANELILLMRVGVNSTTVGHFETIKFKEPQITKSSKYIGFFNGVKEGVINDNSRFENNTKLGKQRCKTIEIKFGGTIGAPYGRDQYTLMGHIGLIGDDGIDYGLNSNGATWTASSTHTTDWAASNIGADDTTKGHHMTNTGDKWYKCVLTKEQTIEKIFFRRTNANGFYSWQDSPKNIEVYIDGVRVLTTTLKEPVEQDIQIDNKSLPTTDGSNNPKWVNSGKLGTGSYEFKTGRKDVIKPKQDIQKVKFEAMTCSAWFKIPNGESQHNDWGSYIIHNSDNHSIGSSIYTLAVNTSGTIAWGWAGGYGNATTTHTYNDGEWHLATGIWTGTESALYVDGEQYVRYNTTTNKTGEDGVFEIGTTDLNPSGYGYRQFNGQIDDIRIYSTALSSEEILKLYQSRFNIDSKGNFSLNELNNLELSNVNEVDKYNLVTNGNVQLKDNTNFSAFTYVDNVDGEGFEDDTRYATRTTNEFIEFDFRDHKKECDISFTMKNTSGNGQEHRNYSGISCYDKHKSHIVYRYVHHYTNTQTTLAQDLNNGDTIVYLTSAANWHTSIDGSSTRYLGIHNLPDYPAFTYTNKTYHYSTAETVGNTLTLDSPYSGSTVLAGTNVANQFDGGGYEYITSGNALLVDGQEATYSATFDHNTLRYGTKYFRPLMLLNRNTETGLPYKTLIKDITVEGRYGDFEKDKKVSFQENSVYSSNIDEIGMTEGLVGYWKFDNLSDYSNEENNLRNFGVSITGGIAEFDGVSSLTVPDNTSLDLDYITMINIIKTDASQIGQNILFNKESSYISQVAITTGVATYSSAIMTDSNYPSWDWVGHIDVPLNEWVFVATVWNGQKVVNYINDQKIEVDNHNGGIGSIKHSNNGLGIGSRGVPADGSTKGQNFFKGDMKESRIYNRILTEDEVLTLYKIMMKETSNIKDNVFYVNEINEV